MARDGMLARLLRRGSTFLEGGPRVRGRPTSANGASSFHLYWEVPGGVELTGAAVTLVIAEPPAVPRLYFWAMQVSFPGGAGAHLGLQWGADSPRGMRHANWGGYGTTGAELTGTPSALPSSFANQNTRDFAWEPGRPYRLRIAREPEGWAGWVDGTLVRHLHAPGETLTAPMVWSEVFADCDDPPVSVRWSEPVVVTRSGERVPVRAALALYQRRGDGGCDNTCSTVDGDSLVQTTSTSRLTPPGTRLVLG